MEKNEWLNLSEYSRRYHVSVSTLRRRIKSNQVEFGYRNGKYFLRNKPLEDHGSMSPVNEKPVNIAPPQETTHQTTQRVESSASIKQTVAQASQDEAPVLATAHKLLNELKKAYTLILQEKEEQIIQLKEQVADLQTLVRVLEKQNEPKESKEEVTPMEVIKPISTFESFPTSSNMFDEDELYITPAENTIGLDQDPWLD